MSMNNRFSDLTPKCDQCTKPVYMLEELKIKDKTFHKSCFKCNLCHKILDKNIYNQEKDGSNEFYCRNCFSSRSSNTVSTVKSKQENMNQTSFKIVIKKPVSKFLNENKAEFLKYGSHETTSEWTRNYFQHSSFQVHSNKQNEKLVHIQSNNCDQCNKPVYMFEELKSGNKIYHKLCFKCTLCNKLLETNASNQHENDLFCKSCYGKKFRPKAFANDVIDESDSIISTVAAEKSAFNSYSKSNDDQNVVSIKQLASVYSKIENKIEPKQKPKINKIVNIYTQVQKESEIKLNEEQNVKSFKEIANIFQEPNEDENVGSLANIRHLANIYSQNKLEPNKKKAIKTSQHHVKFNETVIVRKPVIVNEEILDNLSSSPDLDHFNSNHYKKDYQNDNRLLDSPKLSSKFKNIESENSCSRCEKTVYATEKFMGGKRIYHLNCFKCVECNKKLNLSNYFENNDEIYCKLCVNGKNTVVI